MGIRRTQQEKEDLIEKWGDSGLSKIKFCFQNKINPNTFKNWLKKEKEGIGEFLSVSVDSSQSSSKKAPSLKLEMEVSGVVIRIFE